MERALSPAQIVVSLGLAPGLLFGAILGFASGYWISVARPDPAVREAMRPTAESVVRAAEAQAALEDVRLRGKALVLAVDSPRRAAEARAAWAGGHERGRRTVEAFEREATGQPHQELARTLGAGLAAYDCGVARVLDLIAAGKLGPPSQPGRTARPRLEPS